MDAKARDMLIRQNETWYTQNYNFRFHFYSRETNIISLPITHI